MSDDELALECHRLVLRPLTTRDAERMALLAGDWDVARMVARVPHPYTVTDAFRWIASIQGDEVVRGISVDDELVGVCGAAPDPETDGVAEIGYWLGKDYWGNGYATEAAHALCLHCFNALGYQRLTSRHFKDNGGSRRVLKKLGFTRRGVEQHWCEARMQIVASVRYDLVPRRLKRPKKR